MTISFDKNPVATTELLLGALTYLKSLISGADTSIQKKKYQYALIEQYQQQVYSSTMTQAAVRKILKASQNRSLHGFV